MNFNGLVMIFLSSTVFSLSAHAGDYCLALRGNGELVPAHWGAVGQVVEKLGLPRAQAGGSSAAITMFFLDAIASNPRVRLAGSPEQSLRASLLVKSLQGFLQELKETKTSQDVLYLYGQLSEVKAARTQDGLQLDGLEKLLAKMDEDQKRGYLGDARGLLLGNMHLVTSIYATGKKLGLIGSDNYAPLFQALAELTSGRKLNQEDLARQIAVARFYAGELKQSITVFGKFNARTDSNLFFRPGVVDFDRLSQQLGQIADFYAADNSKSAEGRAWDEFIDVCASKSAGFSWEALVAAEPRCGQLFHKMFQAHFDDEREGGQFANREIGHAIPSFPATAVLTNSAYKEASAAMDRYPQELNPKFGETFVLSDPEQVRFGYWGRSSWLAKAESASAVSADEKTRRFMNLGSASWKVALGLSPAEPGLSAFKRFQSRGENLISAGGWPDLHPVRVLKDAGCESVVYVTRRGGESIFGQGVAKRLLNLERGWELLNSKDKNSIVTNNNGDTTDMTSLWSRLYNLANAQSSYKIALSSADAILCTNWNAFEVTDTMKEMVQQAYESPFFISPRASAMRSDLGKLSLVLDRSVMHADGYPEFAGCY